MNKTYFKKHLGRGNRPDWTFTTNVDSQGTVWVGNEYWQVRADYATTSMIPAEVLSPGVWANPMGTGQRFTKLDREPASVERIIREAVVNVRESFKFTGVRTVKVPEYAPGMTTDEDLYEMEFPSGSVFVSRGKVDAIEDILSPQTIVWWSEVEPLMRPLVGCVDDEPVVILMPQRL